jgi:hypothetical protein
VDHGKVSWWTLVDLGKFMGKSFLPCALAFPVLVDWWISAAGGSPDGSLWETSKRDRAQGSHFILPWWISGGSLEIILVDPGGSREIHGNTILPRALDFSFLVDSGGSRPLVDLPVVLSGKMQHAAGVALYFSLGF